MHFSQLDSESQLLVMGQFLFCDLPQEEVAHWLSDSRCTYASAKKGDIIYDPHQFSRCLGLLLSGKVQVSKDNLIVSTLQKGELFGAAALFNDAPDYATTLTARTPCHILFFPQALVEEWMTVSPSVARNYISYLSGRILFLNEKIEGLIAGSAEEKLTQFLLSHQEGDMVRLDCSVTGLASRLHVSRASLYRAFDGLERAKAIEKKGKLVKILDIPYLEHHKERNETQ